MPFTGNTTVATRRADLEEILQFDVTADAMGYIGTQVFPRVDVAMDTGQFAVIPVESMLQDPETRRAPKASYNTGDWEFSIQSYVTQEYGWVEKIDQKERKIYADFLELEMVATMRAHGIIMRGLEKRIADAVFNPATWTGADFTTGVTNEWDANHTADANPIGDIEYACQKVWKNSGLWPNALIISRRVFRNLRNLDQIVERIASMGAGDRTLAADITAQQLAQVFDLEHVFVANGSRNTASKGQSVSVDSIWSDEYAMVCRVSSGGDLQEPCIGRTFHYSQDGSQIDGLVETWWDENFRSDIVRVRHDTQEKLLYKEAGHLLSNVTTA